MSNHLTSLLQSPRADEGTALHFFEKLEQNTPDAKWESLYSQSINNRTVEALLSGIFANSPYLSGIINKHPEWLLDLLREGLEESYSRWVQELDKLPLESDEQNFIKTLRQHKMKGALIIAWGDLSQQWSLERVTLTLSELAERVLTGCTNRLIHQMSEKGLIEIASPERSGIIVLAMGKLGGHELNYSSDVDLILLFDPQKIVYHGRKSLQHVMNRFAQDLSRLMQERTADGYVFRVDLRLRPDPASTPPIVNRDAAIRYYESVGQNWERAAFTKARPIAGDFEAGKAFLQELRPFIWRKNLDFAAINDIHTIRKQMSGGSGVIEDIHSHNIKTGLGGIREIEFIAHTYQLIWGGKQPALRTLSTCETLHQAQKLGLLEPEEFRQLTQHYRFLREVEHRLQMMHDQQTHTIPSQESELLKLSLFCGFQDYPSFAATLLEHLRGVHKIYFATIEGDQDSTTTEGPLTFTGVEADPATIRSLQKLGYDQPELVIQEIQNWHRGNIRAMRQLRARQLLTKLTPDLLKALGKTTSPDQSFQHFSKFLAGLPSGIQLFSLFSTQTQLLDDIAMIMGYAPQLAEQFARHPEWLEILLTGDIEDKTFQEPNPEAYLRLSHHPDDDIRLLCQFRNEWEFLIGTRLLRRKITPEEVKYYLTLTADAALEKLVDIVWQKFKERYGTIEGSNFAIIALGRLGSREVTFGSDLDLIFVFDAEDMNRLSDGDKQISASIYYTRLCQRIVGAAQAATSAGHLYEIDTRLRPGGESQALAIHYNMFDRYYRQDAWTFEKMALLRHRIIYAAPKLEDKLRRSIDRVMQTPQDEQQLKADILDIRGKMARNFGWKQKWDVKHAQGGLIDVTFLAQFIALCHGHEDASLLRSAPTDILQRAEKKGLVPAEESTLLQEGFNYQERVHTILRLCQQNFDNIENTAGLKELMINMLEAEKFEDVKKTLNQHQKSIYEHFRKRIGNVIT